MGGGSLRNVIRSGATEVFLLTGFYIVSVV